MEILRPEDDIPEKPVGRILTHQGRSIALVDLGHEASEDEPYVGGLRKNMSKAKRAAETSQGGPAGKQAVVGMKDRQTGQVAARVIDTVDGETLNSFVDEHTHPGGDGLHGRLQLLPGAAQPRGRSPQRGRVRSVHGGRCGHPHERRGIVLVHADARAQGDLPPAQREAPAAVRERVRRTA